MKLLLSFLGMMLVTQVSQASCELPGRTAIVNPHKASVGQESFKGVFLYYDKGPIENWDLALDNDSAETIAQMVLTRAKAQGKKVLAREKRMHTLNSHTLRNFEEVWFRIASDEDLQNCQDCVEDGVCSFYN